MEILSLRDPAFARYGRIVKGNFTRLLALLKKTPLPEEGTIYCPGDPKLEEKEIVSFFQKEVYGNMPVQVGYCNGHNQKLNCLEYHKGNEVNLANEDFILLLSSYFDIENGILDTKKVQAFRVPKGVAVEIYSTTLHYAPCGIAGSSFQVLVVLPKGTNVRPDRNPNDPTLWATNKWLLAHADAREAKAGAYVGLVGDNIEI